MEKVSIHTILLTFSLLFINYCDGKISSFEWKHDNSYDGFISHQFILKSDIVRSVIKCGECCQNLETCNGFFFIGNHKNCTLVSGVDNMYLEPHSGAKFYQRRDREPVKTTSTKPQPSSSSSTTTTPSSKLTTTATIQIKTTTSSSSSSTTTTTAVITTKEKAKSTPTTKQSITTTPPSTTTSSAIKDCSDYTYISSVKKNLKIVDTSILSFFEASKICSDNINGQIAVLKTKGQLQVINDLWNKGGYSGTEPDLYWVGASFDNATGIVTWNDGTIIEPTSELWDSKSSETILNNPPGSVCVYAQKSSKVELTALDCSESGLGVRYPVCEC